MNTKVNLFEQFDDTAKTSDGLKTLERTKISLTTEQRTKTFSTVVTPTEHQAIRKIARDLDEAWGRRVTVSDIGRELWLLLLGEEAGNQLIREEISQKLKDNI